MVPPPHSDPSVPPSVDITVHTVNTVYQSELLSLFCIPIAASEQVSSLQSLATTCLNNVNKYLVIIIHSLLDDLKIILLHSNVMIAHQFVWAGGKVACRLVRLVVQLLFLFHQFMLPLGNPGRIVDHSDTTNWSGFSSRFHQNLTGIIEHKHLSTE